MTRLGPRTTRRLGCGLLIAVSALIPLLLLAATTDICPPGIKTAQVRLDTGDLRYCILFVPCHYDRMRDGSRQILLTLSAMDPPVPAKWYTVARYPLQGSNNPDLMVRSFYASLVPWAELDPRLGRLMLDDIVDYIRATGAQHSLPQCVYLLSPWHIKWDEAGGLQLTPDWVSDSNVLFYMASKAYRPVRLDDSVAGSEALIWPVPHDPVGRDAMGRTALHRAAFWGREDLVRLMVAQGLDRYARDKDGWTPLHVAAFWGQVAVVQALLDAGDSVDLDARGGKAMVFSDYAAERWEQWDALGATALHLAAVEGRLDVVRCLLDRGARVDALDANGRTPLMWAAAAGRAEVVKELLARGANASLLDSQGMSARDWAKKFGRTTAEGLLK